MVIELFQLPWEYDQLFKTETKIHPFWVIIGDPN
jgi:hypothetical protein